MKTWQYCHIKPYIYVVGAAQRHSQKFLIIMAYLNKAWFVSKSILIIACFWKGGRQARGETDIQLVYVRKNCYQRGSKLHWKPFQTYIEKHLVMFLRSLIMLYRNKARSVLHHLVNFHLNWIFLSNVKIRFLDKFCLRTSITFWHDMHYRHVSIP